MSVRVGIINGDMIGTKSCQGEYVDWNEPDYFDVDVFECLVEQSIEEYAAKSRHMIIWEV